MVVVKRVWWRQHLAFRLRLEIVLVNMSRDGSSGGSGL